MISLFRTFGSTFLILIVSASPLFAQAKLPKPPDSYGVELRYRIKADRNERIRQFEQMTKTLRQLGFKEKEIEDNDLAIFDPSAERMSGTIPSSGARSILAEPHIQALLLVPAGFKPPKNDNDRVKVLLELSRGFVFERQQLFSSQIKKSLESVGFQEAASYDHRGYTILRGTIPWIKVPPLLKDLRGQPSGWFLPLTPENELPEPFNSKLPIRLIEVFSEESAPPAIPTQTALPPIPADQPYLVKLSADLRRYLAQEGKAGLPLRAEVMLDSVPDEVDGGWRGRIRFANPSTAIEGRLGNIVTVTVSAGEQIKSIARLPSILSIRLPRGGSSPPSAIPMEEPKEKAFRSDIIPIQVVEQLDVLKETRLDRLHAKGIRGTRVRVAIFDTDFTGYKNFIGRGLPKTTHYVDLTAERNSEILPEPTNTPEGSIGHGTHCALAVRFAAPEADLVLIRIAPDAPYQLVTAYRYIRGEYDQPESFRARREELEIDSSKLRNEHLKANDDYRKAFDNFDDDEASREKKRAAKAAIADVQRKEIVLTARANRLLNLEIDLAGVKGASVILNTVGWNSGQPLDGASALSRFLDEKMTVTRPPVVRNGFKQPRPTVWFQPAGDTRGQAWTGLFRDLDGNGIMEFGEPNQLPHPDRWTPELNFLAFRADGRNDDRNLPENARVRITIQWREPHDPEVSEIEYRQPIASLNLMLFRQRDPNAEKLPSDEMEVISRSDGLPERLLVEREFGVYEQALDVTLPAAGQYALRVDGRQPLGLRPGGSLGIKDQEVRWELRPRIFIEVLDGPTQAKGRIVFGDYESMLGGVAVPADARSVIAVGAMHAVKRPEPFSAIGAGPQSEMFIKPDVMTFDQLPKLGDGSGTAKGTSLSASLATGMGACLLNAGTSPANFLHTLGIKPGHIFEVPEGWLRPR